MPRITEMFAFVAEESPGEEGIMGARAPNGDWFPLVTNNMTTVSALRPAADAIAQVSGLPYRVLRFELIGELQLG